ncbi:efflux RND transporter periplasmic adaptor subunit [bacterium]|nr:efflux RND transporter periplasmic adaptor subunit [bacterium]
MKTILVAALAAASVAGLSGCGGKGAEVRPVGEEIRCGTGTAELAELPVVATATASVEPEVRVTVSTRMMGWVSELHVREGDAVVKGQRLLTIDDQDMKAKRAQVEAGIREAEAVVANAERMAARFENLYAAKAVSKSQLDDVQTGLDRARAGLAQAEAARAEIQVHLGYLDIKAPMSGVVTRRMVEEGDMANPGHPLLYIDRIERMKVVAGLGEKDVNNVRAGDRAHVQVSSLDDATYIVEVARVIPAANPGSRTYDVEMYLDNADGRLWPGMFARVRLETGRRQGVLVPRSALIDRGQLTGVFTVDAAGEARLRWVRTGDEVGDAVEIVSGLSGGETIVLSSDKPLAECDKVVK